MGFGFPTSAFHSDQGTCVRHERGRLAIQRCTLDCRSRPLPHLWAPLLTSATGQQMEQGQSPGAAGLLSVFECKLFGGATAVVCRGSGRVQVSATGALPSLPLGVMCAWRGCLSSGAPPPVDGYSPVPLAAGHPGHLRGHGGLHLPNRRLLSSSRRRGGGAAGCRLPLLPPAAPAGCCRSGAGAARARCSRRAGGPGACRGGQAGAAAASWRHRAGLASGAARCPHSWMEGGCSHGACLQVAPAGKGAAAAVGGQQLSLSGTEIPRQP